MQEDLEEAQYGTSPFDNYVTSIHEQNVSGNYEGNMKAAWLRTCYDEDPNEKYEGIRINAEITRDRYLDGNTRYAFGNGSPDH
ncbi:hypothetical protein N7447_006446 [Penicillium robsamsonii]|uniref:uncharacterized protein n=1 Tax=Penicillium robsamsonii TaxID=1792511 RepID=UPI00254688B4|nr:uncharacterized protein N7447_006446 [Penicillium robsamsonii]KAJ5824106.1 hypothetical protein N7447_006446 [Penicillium robsamsonii]